MDNENDSIIRLGQRIEIGSRELDVQTRRALRDFASTVIHVGKGSCPLVAQMVMAGGKFVPVLHRNCAGCDKAATCKFYAMQNYVNGHREEITKALALEGC